MPRGARGSTHTSIRDDEPNYEDTEEKRAEEPGNDEAQSDDDGD